MDELVEPADLTGFPGAPFSREVVTSAADTVRVDAGWHIAPEVSETVEVETYCNRVAALPSLNVVDVTEVRDADTGAVITGWRVNKRTGVIRRRDGGWPPVIEVDLNHGYEACPPALFSVIAERAQRVRAGLIAQESLGSRSVSHRTGYDPVARNVMARFSLPGRP